MLRIQVDTTVLAFLTMHSEDRSHDTPKNTPAYTLVVHSQLHLMTHCQLAGVCSQVSLLDTPKCNSETLSSRLASMPSSTFPTALDGILPAYFVLYSQECSQEGRYFQSHFDVRLHSYSCMHDPETCWIAVTSCWVV